MLLQQFRLEFLCFEPSLTRSRVRPGMFKPTFSSPNYGRDSLNSEPKPTLIDDIALELFAMHCSVGWGIRQKKIPQEK